MTDMSSDGAIAANPGAAAACGPVRRPAAGRGARLAILYVVFAAMAVGANLATQRLVLAAADLPARFVLALAAGTLAGLVVKFLLDRRWIFDDRRTGIGAGSRSFGLYALTGTATTAIFWGTETAFHLIWGGDLMREAGAVLGLAAGYAIKYRLDRRFVFAPSERAS